MTDHETDACDDDAFEFDRQAVFEREVAPALKALQQLCDRHRLPYLVTIMHGRDGETGYGQTVARWTQIFPEHMALAARLLLNPQAGVKIDLDLPEHPTPDEIQAALGEALGAAVECIAQHRKGGDDEPTTQH